MILLSRRTLLTNLIRPLYVGAELNDDGSASA